MPPLAGNRVKASDMPRVLDYDEITANTSEITTITDVGPTVTFTLTEAREVSVKLSGLAHSGTAGDTFLFTLADGSNNIQSYSGNRTLDVAGNEMRIDVEVHFASLAAGTYTYKFRCTCSTSVGTTTVHASATNPAWIRAIDWGTP